LPLVEALDREFPQLTYDVPIKVEHLLQNSDLLATLRANGCLFIVSAVESLDDDVLQRLAKNHTRKDFLRAVELCRKTGITLQPTFVPFTPWTTGEQIADLFEQIARLELVEAVPPVQLAIRLLVTASSRLLELDEVRSLVGPFDANALVYPWKHSDPRMDRLCEELQDIVASSEKLKRSRTEAFHKMWNAASSGARSVIPARATVPYLNEPWYC